MKREKNDAKSLPVWASKAPLAHCAASKSRTFLGLHATTSSEM